MMKLLVKTNIYISIATIILMLAGMIIVYFLILNKINHEVDEHLILDKNKIVYMLNKGKHIKHFSSNIGEHIDIKEIATRTIFGNKFNYYKTTEVEGEEGEEELTYRQLLFQTTINNKHYEVKISHSLSEKEEIREYITTTIILFVCFSFFILFLLNLVISKLIWSPFYDIMNQLKTWTFSNNKAVSIPKTNIAEFIELEQTINMFIHKIQTDYIELKEFTENISHETQTPVSIISAKLEMLMQEFNYSTSQKQLLMDAFKATLRLKKLNQSLILLTKIERNYYTTVEKADIAELIEQKLAEMQDFITAKNLKITKTLVSVEKELNPEIFNILINNLLFNAIKHNVENGSIKISLTTGKLMIENTGFPGPIEKENIFARFKPYTTENDSIGLGLAIIKKIADFFQWEISYSFTNDQHLFTLRWS